MAAGPIGACWAEDSWEDTAWEANTWADLEESPPATIRLKAVTTRVLRLRATSIPTLTLKGRK